MSISFAGSRCVDERRRRRLAQEAEPESSPERRPAPRARSAHRHRTDSPAPAYSAPSPVESLVRPQLWWSVLQAVLGLAVSAGAVWLGCYVDAVRPALSASVGLENGLLIRSLVALHFLLAAQFGYVILWYRTRSRKDFCGQYKLWRWVEPAWLLFAVASAIDGPTLIRELSLPLFPAGFRHAETLCWMAPAAILVLTTTRFLLHDMREDRYGGAFVVLSGIGAAMAALIVLSGPLMAFDQTTLRVLKLAGVNVWSLGALLSMLFHARYVIHVTNEAPRTAEPGRIVAILRKLLPALRGRNRVAPDVDDDDPSAGTASDADDSAHGRPEKIPEKRFRTTSSVPSRPHGRDVQKAAAPERTAPGGRSSVKVEEPCPVTSDVPPERTLEAKPASHAIPRAAESEDEPLHGLSKKERRRLRKQQRQQQQPREARL